MKNFSLLCWMLMMFYSGNSQSFPASFIGEWQGDLVWHQPAKNPQKIKMSLVISPADTAGHYNWQIIYGEKKEDNRPYILKPIDPAKGHWIIDENNGINLDQFWIGNTFSGAFTVQNSTIVNKYWLEKKRLHVEFLSIDTTPVQTTGGRNNIPTVTSYRVKSYQKAILKRKRVVK